MTDQQAGNSALDSAVAEYLRRVDVGETCDRDGFRRFHSSIAEQLTTFWDDLDFVSWYHHSWDTDCEDTRTTLHGGSVRQDAVSLSVGTSAETSESDFPDFGDYELLEELGRGGMGVVFRARQKALNRTVCIKMMLLAELADDEESRRFSTEALSIAQLNHPGIVAIYEVGTHRNNPYYTMEFIDGVPLSQRIATGPLTPQIAARYVSQIARAVQYAHTNGIVHRDLKPSNILIDRFDHPHVTDFGLAKYLGSSEDLTVTGQVLGTPAYMSPEQATAHHREVGSHSDIYSLGAILYALVTGRPPHRAGTALETVRRVAHQTPIAPRTLNGDIPRDLETICLKCLEKSPSSRYSTAADLADDLQQFMAGGQITAHPVSPFVRMTSWIARHPGRSALALGLATASLRAALALVIQNRELSALNRAQTIYVERLDGALKVSRENEMTARNLKYVSDMPRIEQFWLDGDFRAAAELLDGCVPRNDQVDLRGLEWYVLKHRQWTPGKTILAANTPFYFVKYSREGDLLAVAGGADTVHLIDARTFQVVSEIDTGQHEVNGLDFSRKADRLATAGDDGTLKIWDLESHHAPVVVQAFQGHAFTPCFVSDDQQVAVCGAEPEIRIYDAATGEATGQLVSHEEAVDTIAVSRDRTYLASVSGDRRAIVFDLRTLEPMRVESRFVGPPIAVAYSPDGSFLVAGGFGNRLHLVSSNKPEANYFVTRHVTQSIAINATASSLAVGDRSGVISLWSIESAPEMPCGVALKRLTSWRAHDGRVFSLAFDPNTGQLVSAGSDGRVRHWRIDRVLRSRARASWVIDNSNRRNGLVFAPKTHWLASANPKTGIEFWDHSLPSAKQAEVLPLLGAQTLGLSSDGKSVAAGTDDGHVVVWDRRSRQIQHEWNLGEPITQLVFSRDNDQLAVVASQTDSAFGQTQLYQLESGEAVFERPIPHWRRVAFAPDGDTLYVALDVSDYIIAWDLTRHVATRVFNYHDTTIEDLSVSPTGRYVLSFSKDHHVLLHDTHTELSRAIHTGLHGNIVSACFGPLDRTVVVLDTMGVVRACNLRAGRRVVDLARMFSSGPAKSLALTADGRTLAVGWQNWVQVVDLLPADVLAVPFASTDPSQAGVRVPDNRH